MKKFFPFAIAWIVLAITILQISCKEDLNKDFTTAFEISDGQLVQGRAKDTDLRYYKLIFPSAGLITLKVSNAKSGFKIFILEKDDIDTPIADAISLVRGKEYQNVFGPLPLGTHYIAVQTDSAYADYNFSVFLDFSDATEMNNTFDQSKEISLGQPTSGKVLAQNDKKEYEDSDIYKFSIKNKPAVVKVTVTAPSQINVANAFIAFSLFNAANENSFLEDGKVKQGQTSSFLVGPLDVGDHFIAINYNGLCNCQSLDPYTFIIDLDARDANEPNDIPTENATAIQFLDKKYEGTFFFPNSLGEQDIDWFKFEPTETGNYTFELIGAPNAVCTRAYVYQQFPGGSPIKSMSACDALVDLEKLSLTGGTPYWIKVQMNAKEAESNGTYGIRISR